MLVSDWLTDSLTHSLTHSCLVNLIDVTLACEDTNSKLVDIVTVANVDDEDCIGNSLLQIWELRIVHKAKLLFRLWAQGLVKISKLKFRQHLKLEFVIWTQPSGPLCLWQCLYSIFQKLFVCSFPKAFDDISNQFAPLHFNQCTVMAYYLFDELPHWSNGNSTIFVRLKM